MKYSTPLPLPSPITIYQLLFTNYHVLITSPLLRRIASIHQQQMPCDK